MTEQTEVYKSIEIQAPNHLKLIHRYTSVFLAGSIEMGKAEEWQKRIVNSTPNKPYIFFNPRRDDWDSSWTQEITDVKFRQQVEWELEALEIADWIVMYFDPKTLSPISLIELGLHAREQKLIVICPDGFWKKGNVDITCAYYNIKQIDSIDKFIEMLNNDELKKH
jgi:hypothetical protein